MPSSEIHIPLATAGVGALLNGAISVIFDLPPAMVWTVFTGAFIGLMFSPAVKLSDSRFGKLSLFLKTLALLVVVTILASWLVPVEIHFLPSMAPKGIAGFTGFILMVKHQEVIKFIDYLIDRARRRSEK